MDENKRGRDVTSGREARNGGTIVDPAIARDAWAAGIIDSDGCIAIKRNGRYYYVSVVVGQTGRNSPMLSQLREAYGGSISKSKKRTSPGGYEPAAQWQVVRLAADRLLKRVIPYLLIKHQQASIALDFRAYVGAAGRRRTDEQVTGQASAFRAIRAAKNVGPSLADVRASSARVPASMFDAWVAGMLDGDGSIGICIQRGMYFYEQVSVGQPEEGRGALELLADVFGGSVSLRRRKNRPPFYHWSVVGQSASALLVRTSPHLVQKRGHADVVLRYRGLVGAPGKRRTPEVKAQQRALYEEMKRINRYGTRRLDTKRVRAA